MIKRVMVTGGAGFIGSHLVDLLADQVDVVCCVDNFFLGKPENINPTAIWADVDVSNWEDLYRFIVDFKPGLVYNLAVVPLPHSLKYPYGNVQQNIAMVQNLCEMQRMGLFKKMVHFSSSEVYGSAQYEPMCENHPWKASTPYAASKAAGDMICLSYVRTFGCDISIIRPFNNYGPRQNAGSYAGIIPLTINRIKCGDPIIVYGDGEQTRDYIFVKDTAMAAVMMGKRMDLKGEVINVASGHEYSINWLVKEIRELMGCQYRQIDYQPARPGDVRRHIANVIKAKDVLKFEHSVPMDQGLKETIKYYLAEENIF